jgi:hypothetical protein
MPAASESVREAHKAAVGRAWLRRDADARRGRGARPPGGDAQAEVDREEEGRRAAGLRRAGARALARPWHQALPPSGAWLGWLRWAREPPWGGAVALLLDGAEPAQALVSLPCDLGAGARRAPGALKAFVEHLRGLGLCGVTAPVVAARCGELRADWLQDLAPESLRTLLLQGGGDDASWCLALAREVGRRLAAAADLGVLPLTVGPETVHCGFDGAGGLDFVQFFVASPEELRRAPQERDFLHVLVRHGWRVDAALFEALRVTYVGAAVLLLAARAEGTRAQAAVRALAQTVSFPRRLPAASLGRCALFRELAHRFGGTPAGQARLAGAAGAAGGGSEDPTALLGYAQELGMPALMPGEAPRCLGTVYDGFGASAHVDGRRRLVAPETLRLFGLEQGGAARPALSPPQAWLRDSGGDRPPVVRSPHVLRQALLEPRGAVFADPFAAGGDGLVPWPLAANQAELRALLGTRGGTLRRALLLGWHLALRRPGAVAAPPPQLAPWHRRARAGAAAPEPEAAGAGALCDLLRQTLKPRDRPPALERLRVVCVDRVRRSTEVDAEGHEEPQGTAYVLRGPGRYLPLGPPDYGDVRLPSAPPGEALALLLRLHDATDRLLGERLRALQREAWPAPPGPRAASSSFGRVAGPAAPDPLDRQRAALLLRTVAAPPEARARWLLAEGVAGDLGAAAAAARRRAELLYLRRTLGGQDAEACWYRLELERIELCLHAAAAPPGQ